MGMRQYGNSLILTLGSPSWVLIGPDWPSFTDPPYLPSRSLEKDHI